MFVLTSFLILFSMVNSDTFSFNQLLDRVTHRDKQTGAIINLSRIESDEDHNELTGCFSKNLWFEMDKIDDSFYLVQTGVIGAGQIGGCLPDMINERSYKFKINSRLDEEYKRQLAYKRKNDSLEKIRIYRIRKLTNNKLKIRDTYCTAIDSLGSNCEEAFFLPTNEEWSTLYDGCILKHNNIYLLFYHIKGSYLLQDVQKDFDSLKVVSESSLIHNFMKINENGYCKEIKNQH